MTLRYGRRWLAAVVPAVALVFWCVPTAASATSTGVARGRLLYARGLAPFQGGDWNAAYRIFDQAARSDPSNALALYYRGITAARLGLWDVARQDVVSALRLRRYLPGAALDLGVISFELKRYDDSEHWLRKAAEQPDLAPVAHLFLGLVYYRKDDDEAALAQFQASAEHKELRPTARYYSSLILLRGKRDAAARKMLEQLQAEFPGTQVAAVAARYLTQEKRSAWPAGHGSGARAWSVETSVGFEYDSNVVLAPNGDTLRATRSISNVSDGRMRFGLRGKYRFLDRSWISGVAGYDFSQSVHFTLTEFDLQENVVHADLVVPIAGLQAGISGSYGFYALDYQSFLQEGGVSPWLVVPEGDRWATELYYRFRGRDYLRVPFEPFLDAFNHALGVRQVWGQDKDRQVSLGAQFDAEDPISNAGEEFRYQGVQVDLDLSHPLGERTEIRGGVLLRLEDYKEVNSRGGGRRRHDFEQRFALRLEQRLTDRWTVDLGYAAALHGSNIDAFSYDRHIISTGVSCRF